MVRLDRDSYVPAVPYSPVFARRSPQHKKHKTWDGDGVLVIRGLTSFKLFDKSSTLYETNDVPVDAEPNNLHTRLASGPPNPIPTKLENGTCLKWAEKEAHLDFPITHQDFLSGRYCSPIHIADVDTAPVRTSAPSIKQFVPPKQFRPPTALGSSSAQRKPISLHPVNLIKPPGNPANNASSSSKAIPDSYWSAQWSVGIPSFAILNAKVPAGGNPSKRNTELGMATVLLRAQKEGFCDSYQSLGKCEKFHASPESQTLTETSDEDSA